MKNLCSIILLVLSLTASAQHKEAIKSIAINSSIVALEAIGDGMLDQGRSEGNQNMMVAGHALQAASVGLLLAKPLLQDLTKEQWIKDIMSYGFIRVGTFNIEYNTTRGMPAGYVGSTSLYDRGLRKLKSPNSWIVGGQMWFLTVGIAIPFNEF